MCIYMYVGLFIDSVPIDNVPIYAVCGLYMQVVCTSECYVHASVEY